LITVITEDVSVVGSQFVNVREDKIRGKNIGLDRLRRSETLAQNYFVRKCPEIF